MPSQSEKAATFRALHQGPGAFIIANPFDAGSARLLAERGVCRHVGAARWADQPRRGVGA